MAIKMTQKDFDLVDKVLDDYAAKGKTSEVCPYCDKPLYKDTVGASYSVQCGTQGCFLETFRGI